MNRALASIGIAAAVVCGSAGPALAADNPIDAKITYISSGSSQVSAPQSGTSTPSTKPSPSETPIPSTRPSTKAEAPKTSETKLAKTGSNAAFLVVLVPFIIAIGTICAFAARKEDN